MTPEGTQVVEALPVGSSALFETTANQCAFHGVGERFGGLCFGCRVDLAVEALRKARATMDCRWREGVISQGCGGDDVEELFSEHHPEQASALLDGFSVDEITAAEEALA